MSQPFLLHVPLSVAGSISIEHSVVDAPEDDHGHRGQLDLWIEKRPERALLEAQGQKRLEV